MLIRARIENYNEWLFLEEIPEKYVAGHRLSERQINIKHAPIDMKNYQLSTNGMFVLHSEMSFSEVAKIESEVEGDAIACQFIFSKKKLLLLKQLVMDTAIIIFVIFLREKSPTKLSLN